MDNEEARKINRRKLLRRGGAVAAAVAGAGAVAAIANPASAADGDNLQIGANNTGTNTTQLTAGSGPNPAMRLNNANGAGLTLGPLVTTMPSPDPSTWTFQPANSAAPVGSLYADDWGDFFGIGQPGGTGGKYVNPIYSPTWATMVVPISPIRYMDTRTLAGREFIVPGSANFDGSFRVLPKNSNTVPDLVLDFSFIVNSSPIAAVQANFTVLLPTAQGFASLWDEGDWPQTSSVNYTPSVAEIANFTQTVIGGDGKIRLKTQRAAQFIVDIVGFVVADPFTQFDVPTVAGPGAARIAKSMGRYQKRRP